MKQLKALLILMGILLPIGAMAQFMSSDEIKKEYEMLSSKKAIMSDKLTDEGKMRLKHMKPRDVFISPDVRKRLKSKYKSQIKGEKVSITSYSTDWRFRDTPIKEQDDGKCTAYAGTALVENLAQRNGKIPGLDLSEWSAWYYYGQYSCDAFVNAMTKSYFCDEKDYPQYGSRSSQCANNSWIKLKNVTYIDDDANAVVEALSRGNIVYIGMATPNSMLNCDTVINPNSGVADGGHALAIVGHEYAADGTVLVKLKNSWGTNCGDRGYQYYPMSMCSRPNAYCVMWEFASVDSKKPLPTPVPTIVPTIIPTTTAVPTIVPTATAVPTVIPTIPPTPKPEPTCIEWKCNWWTLCIKKICTKWSE